MSTLTDTSTWLYIAGVFGCIKFVFWYLAWLFYDKDKNLRDNIEQLFIYLSKHSYFEIMRDTMVRLYNRLSNLSLDTKKGVLYLFLVFWLINLGSLWAGKYWFNIKSEGNLALALHLPVQYEMKKTLDIGGSLVFVSQLSLLDLYSFLFTMGIIWIASRSKNFLSLLFELITDIVALVMFFILVFSCLHYWLFKNIYLSLLGSFEQITMMGILIWMSYIGIKYPNHSDAAQRRSELEPFGSLCNTVFFSSIIIMCIDVSMRFMPSFMEINKDISSSFGTFCGLLFGLFMPIILVWGSRLFIWQSDNELDYSEKIIAIGSAILFFGGGIYVTVHYNLLSLYYSIVTSLFTSKLLLILGLSSTVPSFAHLIAITTAVLAKLLQPIINRHLNALVKHEEKILKQLGNACAGTGALITAILKLI